MNKLNQSYDLAFRPEVYFGTDAELRANIMGQWRRDIVSSELEAGQGDEIPEALFASNLEDPLRDFIGGIHPMMMGGEYLPELDEQEVEIARVSLASTTSDVISIRARREDDQYFYSIVDEYPEDWRHELKLEHSDRPLTFGELVQLIDTSRRVSSEGGVEEDYGHSSGAFGLVMPFYYGQWDAGNDPEEMLSFVRMSSEFYPEIHAYYEDRARAWRKEIDKGNEDEESEE
jgi:hypothetical protein